MALSDWEDRFGALINTAPRRKLVALSGVAVILVVAEVFASDWTEAHIWTDLRLGARYLVGLPMGYGGVALFVTLLAIVLLAFIDTSPTATAIRGWLVKRRPQPSPTDVATANEFVAHNATKTELAAVRTELTNTRSQFDELWWRVEFGSERPSFHVQNKEESDTVKVEVARLASVLEALDLSLQPLIDDLVDRCQRRGSGDFGFWFAGLFRKLVISHLRNSVRFIRSPGQLQPREAFVTFFLAYRDFREWVPRISAALSIEESELQGYSAWRAVDAQLFAELDRIPAVASTQALRAFIRDQKQDGYPQQLNTAARENPVLKRLAAVSPDEVKFLNLFCVDELPMVPGKPDSFLPNEIYRAGPSLVESGILTKTSVDGIERYCLTDTARAVWNRSGIAASPLKQCIEIDLSAVRGTAASGGGASGSRGSTFG